MQFTTIDNIQRKLRGRLQVQIPEDTEFDSNLFSGDNAYAPTAGAQTVDLLLVEQVARDEESRILLYLSQIYQTPLRLTHPVTIDILSSLADNFICSALIATHFQGQSASIVASDISSAATDMRRMGDMILTQLLASSGIFYPTAQRDQQQTAGVKSSRPIILPGEVLLSQNQIPDILDNNFSFEAKRNVNPQNKYFGNNDCGPCSGRRDGTAASSDPSGYCVENNKYINYQRFDF